jgi:error-prone DNA polymerase
MRGSLWLSMTEHPSDEDLSPGTPPTHTSDGDYVELHAASAFSFLAGASQPETLIERAAELGMRAMALADRNGVYGVARFHTAAQKCDVRAHIGAEIAVGSFGKRLTPAAWLPHQCPEEPPRLLLLCASQTGYRNLCQLITRFKMREATKTEGAATLDDLEEFSDGMICLTGGDEGPLAAALAQGRQAHTVIDRLTAIYGHRNLYIELQRHRQRDEECSQPGTAGACIATCRLPVIATNGVRYATEKDREFSTCSHHPASHIARPGRAAAGAQHGAATLRTAAARWQRCFADIPEAIANTRIVSDRLEFTLDNLGYKFPHYPVPDGETMDSFLDEARGGGRAQTLWFAGQATLCWTRRARRWSMNSSSSPSWALPDTFSSSGTLFATASAMEFWCRGAARRLTPLFAMRLKLRLSIRWAWNCYSSDF